MKPKTSQWLNRWEMLLMGETAGVAAGEHTGYFKALMTGFRLPNQSLKLLL